MKKSFVVMLLGIIAAAGNICVRAEDLTKPQPTKKFKLHALGLGFKTSDMQSERVIPAPDHQVPGVIIGDAAIYYAHLSPPLTLPNSRYTWIGADSPVGATAVVSYPNPGDRAIVLKIRDANSSSDKFIGVATKARSVSDTTEAGYCLSSGQAVAILCATSASDAELATNWSRSPATLGDLGTDFAGDNGKSNAAMHAYWNLLMTRDGGMSFASIVATAHEKLSINFTGIDAGDPHNSSVMDLDNNARGRAIASALSFSTTPGTNDPAGQAAIAAADNAGTLTIMDDVNNSGRGGVLEPSNQ